MSYVNYVSLGMDRLYTEKNLHAIVNSYIENNSSKDHWHLLLYSIHFKLYIYLHIYRMLYTLYTYYVRKIPPTYIWTHLYTSTDRNHIMFRGFKSLQWIHDQTVSVLQYRQAIRIPSRIIIFTLILCSTF